MSQRIPMHLKRRDGLHSASPNPHLPSSPAPASGGQLLDRHTQSQMSARFGHDFSSVRIHTDASAQEAASEAGANAYALGSDIVFGEGQYTPGSPTTERLLAHELTHVVQQAKGGPGDPNRPSSKSDESEREADSLTSHVMAGHSVQVQSAPQAAIARDEEGEGGGFFSSLASGAESLASKAASGGETLLKEGWDATKSAAGSVKDAGGAAYDFYEKQTDFKPLTQALGKGVDWVENTTAENGRKALQESEGHWYAPLMQAGVAATNGMTQVAGGGIKGVGDLGSGIANGFFHPIDTVSGVEGILEHNMTIPGLGSTLKAGHGLYDLAAHGGGEYGHSLGDLADHVLNPMTQMQDDMAYDKKLATGILAPEGWDVWKDKPIEAASRAVTNIAPMILGLGEATAGESGAEAANAARGVKPIGAVGPEGVPLEAAEAGGAGKPPGSLPPDVAPPESAPGGGGPQSPSNGAGNAADFERLKADLAQQEIMGAEPKGSALKGGSGQVRSNQLMEPQPALNPDGTPQMNDNGTPKMNMVKVDGVRNVGGGIDADHSAPIYEQGRIAQDGRVFPLDNGGNITQMPGGVNGKEGIMEYIVDKDGNLVHQQFRPGGGVNGEFGGKPEVRPNNGPYYPDDL